MTIRISVKGLAKFMTGSASGQRRTLRDFKVPKPEGMAQAKYYSPARQAIREYHAKENDPAVLVAAVDDLRKQAARAPSAHIATKLDSNIRALQCYMRYFARAKFAVLKVTPVDFVEGNVRVTATPDLCVEHKGRQTLVKLDLGSAPPKSAAIGIVTQVMFEAAKGAGLPVGPKDVIYLDVTRGALHKGARTRTRLQREIRDACRNIEDLWPGIS